MPIRSRRSVIAASLALVVSAVPFLAKPLRAQPGTGTADSTAVVRVLVVGDETPVASATVRAGRVSARTDSRGRAELRLAAGPVELITTSLGFRSDTTSFTVRAGADTSVTVQLVRLDTELESFVVQATRGERRVEDLPLRVEVLGEEEIAEKVAMTPGDIAMMLNETSGLRVQTTSPSLGGANVRVQGLRGRYTLLLADGLPLYGQAGGLGLLQIPPVDLAQVEIIKGAASALHGGAALGGVINLVARQAGDEPAYDVVLNQTSRGGSDAVLFASAPFGEAWSGTLLAGAHHQRRNDLDRDGWTDMPGYDRLVLRPRAYWKSEQGHSAYLTAGLTDERRTGGTLAERVAPDARPFAEAMSTTRADVGALARRRLPDDGPFGGGILTLRGSAMRQTHEHRFGPVDENDTHTTAFSELSLAVPRGMATWVLGAAVQHDAYRNPDVADADYTYTVPGVFVQADVDAAQWLALSASARGDRHDTFGSFVNPRVSALVRGVPEGALSAWSLRLSAGTGTFAPVPFTEETEVTGLTPLRPFAGIRPERVFSASADLGGSFAVPFGTLELNGTLFGSRLMRALHVQSLADTTATGATRLALVNAPLPTHTRGGELLARIVADPFRVTGTYTYVHSREWDPELAGGAAVRRDVPLTPRHAIGVVASVEEEDQYRIGIEVYYTGAQALADDPYRRTSVPYTNVGILVERVISTPFGTARLFLNGENLGDVRQTRVDPLVRPARGPGGRWTTDVWSILEGRVINGGVRFRF